MTVFPGKEEFFKGLPKHLPGKEINGIIIAALENISIYRERNFRESGENRGRGRKNHMKKRIALVLALAVAMSLAACGQADKSAAGRDGDPSNDPQVTLVYAEVNPLDTIAGQTATEFKNQVERLTQGTVTVDIRGAGTLGSEKEVLDRMLAGDTAVDMTRISAFALTGYGCEKAMLLSMPYTWENRDHWWKFAGSDLARDFLNEPKEMEEPLPIRGIFYGEEGFRHFFTVDPTASNRSLAGRKLRVPDDPVMKAMVESLGAIPIDVDFNQLYYALQSGAVDGAEQPIANYKSNVFREVANYLILDGHTLGAIQVVICDNAWEKLTADQQEALYQAGALARDFNAALSESAERSVLEALKAEGCKVVEVPDKSAWAEACAAVIAEHTASQAELYQKLLDFAD